MKKVNYDSEKKKKVAKVAKSIHAGGFESEPFSQQMRTTPADWEGLSAKLLQQNNLVDLKEKRPKNWNNFDE